MQHQHEMQQQQAQHERKQREEQGRTQGQEDVNGDEKILLLPGSRRRGSNSSKPDRAESHGHGGGAERSGARGARRTPPRMRREPAHTRTRAIVRLAPHMPTCVCISILTFPHTCMRKYLRTYVRTHVHAYVNAYIHTHAPQYVNIPTSVQLTRCMGCRFLPGVFVGVACAIARGSPDCMFLTISRAKRLLRR